MELRQLQAFVAVSKNLSFNRAAAELFITQPTLSHQISELEQELGVRLFNRDNRGVTPTDIGVAMLPYIESVLNTLTTLTTQVRSGTLQLVGSTRLRIAFEANNVVGDATGIIKNVIRFAEENPGVALDKQDISFQDCTEALLRDRVDVCCMIFRGAGGLDSRLSAKTVFREKLCVLYSEQYGELSCEEVLRLLPGFYSTSQTAADRRHDRLCLEAMGIEPKIAAVGNSQSAIAYAELGKCFSLLTRMSYENTVFAGLKCVEIPVPEADIYHKLVWKTENDNINIRKLMDMFPDCGE